MTRFQTYFWYKHDANRQIFLRRSESSIMRCYKYNKQECMFVSRQIVFEYYATFSCFGVASSNCFSFWKRVILIYVFIFKRTDGALRLHILNTPKRIRKRIGRIWHFLGESLCHRQIKNTIFNYPKLRTNIQVRVRVHTFRSWYLSVQLYLCRRYLIGMKRRCNNWGCKHWDE